MEGAPVMPFPLSHSANQMACGSASACPATVVFDCRSVIAAPALEYTPEM
jgi:hypothetical protein